MRMIQEQIEREQKEVEARIPKAQLLPYTTDYPKVRHFWITSIKKPAYLQALLYSWQSMYIDAQICAYAQVPPKPEPKTCTRPVPFQLVSVMRHEEEQQRMAAERAQAEQLEALLKEFRAQPNLSKWASPSTQFSFISPLHLSEYFNSYLNTYPTLLRHAVLPSSYLCDQGSLLRRSTNSSSM